MFVLLGRMLYSSFTLRLFFLCLAATVQNTPHKSYYNKYLNKIGMKDSGICDSCKVAVETTEHCSFMFGNYNSIYSTQVLL